MRPLNPQDFFCAATLPLSVINRAPCAQSCASFVCCVLCVVCCVLCVVCCVLCVVCFLLFFFFCLRLCCWVSVSHMIKIYHRCRIELLKEASQFLNDVMASDAFITDSVPVLSLLCFVCSALLFFFLLCLLSLCFLFFCAFPPFLSNSFSDGSWPMTQRSETSWIFKVRSPRAIYLPPRLSSFHSCFWLWLCLVHACVVCCVLYVWRC